MLARVTTIIKGRLRMIEVYIVDSGDKLYADTLVIVDREGKEVMTLSTETMEFRMIYFFDIISIEYNSDTRLCKLVLR